MPINQTTEQISGMLGDGQTLSSMFMPAVYARRFYKIIEIRAERLQEISEEDAEAEGIQFMREIPDADETLTAKTLYEILWDSINAKPHGKRKAYPWKSNPWVWCLSFRGVE